jgi:RNA polymerase sigma factor (sigma-70 family)
LSGACDLFRPGCIQGNVSSRFAIDVPPELIDSARSGALASLERLYRLFERPGHNLALRLLSDPEDAREVLHDAMLSAFRRLHQFRGDCPFWAWLRQIVVNTALMRQRSRRGHDAHAQEIPDFESAVPDAGPDPLHLAEAAQVERALDLLPAVTRSVVWLFCVEGYSHPEIARAMGQSVSFSKSQLARGLARLRRDLGVEATSHA